MIASLAARQWGVMARRQLVRSGIGDEAIAHRLRAGRLHRLHRGVYVAGHTGLRLEGRLLAATLVCGAGAVISHRTAAALLGIRHGSRELIDVTTVARGRRAPPGIDLHETRRLATWEVAGRSGLPLTSVARTLADLAGVLSARDLERSLERADALQMLDVRVFFEASSTASALPLSTPRSPAGCPPRRAASSRPASSRSSGGRASRRRS